MSLVLDRVLGILQARKEIPYTRSPTTVRQRHTPMREDIGRELE
jgi:hypothetical protein